MGSIMFPTSPRRQDTLELDWGHNGAAPLGTRYLYRNAGAPSTTPQYARASRSCTARAINVRVTTGPGAGVTDTWTLQRNGVDTGLTVSLTDSTASATGTGAESFTYGDDISLKQVCNAGSTTHDVQVTVDFD
jgi:hypothetical protein